MILKHIKNLLPTLCLGLFIFLLSSCSSIISSTSNKLADNLSQTIINSDDPQTVADGAPAYLLLMDSFLIDSPDNISLLQSASTLYGSYAGVFVTDPQRASRMTKKSLAYAEQALCLSSKQLCNIRQLKFNDFSQRVEQIKQNNLQTWFIYASAWAGWVKSNSSSMSAIAELPKVSLIMEQIIKLDETWKEGSAHLYLGVLKTLIPPAFGGKPEQARQHFEQAIEISHGKNLMMKVLFAENYARLIFNKDLHDTLLNEVLQADPYYHNLTLMNILAQKKAVELLDSSNDYF